MHPNRSREATLELEIILYIHDNTDQKVMLQRINTSGKLSTIQRFLQAKIPMLNFNILIIKKSVLYINCETSTKQLVTFKRRIAGCSSCDNFSCSKGPPQKKRSECLETSHMLSLTLKYCTNMNDKPNNNRMQ